MLKKPKDLMRVEILIKIFQAADIMIPLLLQELDVLIKCMKSN